MFLSSLTLSTCYYFIFQTIRPVDFLIPSPAPPFETCKLYFTCITRANERFVYGRTEHGSFIPYSACIHKESRDSYGAARASIKATQRLQTCSYCNRCPVERNLSEKNKTWLLFTTPEYFVGFCSFTLMQLRIRHAAGKYLTVRLLASEVFIELNL